MANPVDPCTGCGQIDDHPKCHVYTGDPERPWISWHKDCHANVGCEACGPELEALPGYERGIIGDEFRELLKARMVALAAQAEAEGNGV
jgi:hypothetical protein